MLVISLICNNLYIVCIVYGRYYWTLAGRSLQGTVLNVISSVFDVVKYISDGVL